MLSATLKYTQEFQKKLQIKLGKQFNCKNFGADGAVNRGNRFRVGARAENASVSGFACRPF